MDRLGKDRIGVFVGDKDKKTIKQFLNSYVSCSQPQVRSNLLAARYTKSWSSDTNDYAP